MWRNMAQGQLFEAIEFELDHDEVARQMLRRAHSALLITSSFRFCGPSSPLLCHGDAAFSWSMWEVGCAGGLELELHHAERGIEMLMRTHGSCSITSSFQLGGDRQACLKSTSLYSKAGMAAAPAGHSVRIKAASISRQKKKNLQPKKKNRSQSRGD